MRLPGAILALLFGVCSPVLAQLVITTTSADLAGTLNQPYTKQLMATGGSGSYFWMFADTANNFPPGLTLNPNGTGAITGTPSLVGNFVFSVVVTDQKQQLSTQKQLTISITQQTAPLMMIDTSPLPSRTLGIFFSYRFTATGGVPPYAFNVQATPFNPNPLPPGLTLGQDGTLSGTPTSAGTFPPFTVVVTDSANSQASKPFTLTINAPPMITTPSALPPTVVNMPYMQQIDVTGGTAPLSFFLSNGPAGLTIEQATGILHWAPTTVNTFTFQVTVFDSQQASDTRSFQLQVTPAPPLLQVTPLSLDFAGFFGGDSPPSQEIDISALGLQSTSFSISIDSGIGVAAVPPAWLFVKPLNGVTPARVIASVDQGRMLPGKYSARIKVTDASQNTTIVLVTLTLTDALPVLEVLPDQLDFSALVDSPGTFERVVALRNAGGGGSIGFTASIKGMSNWATVVEPSSGQTVRNSLVFVKVRVSTAGVLVGSYREQLAFASAGGSPIVPVKLFVARGGPILGTNITGVRLQARKGGGFTNNPTVKVLNLGTGTVNWTAEVVSGNIVTLSTSKGTATPTSPGMFTIISKPEATSQAAGDYYALIRISDPDSQNSPVYVIVVLDLASDTALPLPDPFPAGLVFIGVANGASPSGQTVTVNTSSSTAVPFQSGAVTSDGRNWLSATPTSGRSTGQTAGQFTVAANLAGLAAGVYTGEVPIAMSGVVRSVMITLIVLPAGATPPTGTAFAGAAATPAANCTPSKLVITQTGLINNFEVPAKWPAFLIAQLNDDCGALVNGASVAASFSNGDVPLTLRGDGQSGTYSTTWQPGTTSAQMTITLQAEQGALQPATVQLIGTIDPNKVPVLFKNGTVNVFNRVPAGALAPAMIVEVYGSGLAAPTATPGMLPLPTIFNNTFVLVGPYQVPLYYLSDGQLDVQIAAELAPNQQYPIVVSANGKLTTPQLIDVAPVQLGIAHYDDGHVIAQHGVGSAYVTAASPAKPGEVLVMYLSGMGPTNPAVKSGDAAPNVEPLARVTLTPTVMVNGQMAKLEFAGLTPGFVGLYQVNFDVPTNATTGDLDLVVIQNGVSSNTTKLPVAK